MHGLGLVGAWWAEAVRPSALVLHVHRRALLAVVARRTVAAAARRAQASSAAVPAPRALALDTCRRFSFVDYNGM